MSAREWVLRGRHPRYADGVLIAISGGTYGQCRSARAMRARDGGWSDLAITPDASAPARAARSARDRAH